MLRHRWGSWSIRVAALACVLSVCLALAGCGGSGSGGSGVTANAYATALCRAVEPFEKDIQARQAALDPSHIKSAAQGKTALEGFLSAIADDTKTAASQLKAAGTPNVTNGKAIATAFTNLFSRLEGTLDTAAKQSQSLPTDSPSAFKTAALELGTSVKSSMSDLGAGLSNLKSPALETAAKKVAACKSLN